MHVDIVGVVALSGQKPDILAPLNFSADPVISWHFRPPYSAATAMMSCPEAASTALTML